jgi:hypothetical protein
LSHQRGKKPKKTKQNKTNKKTPQTVPSSNAIQFQYIFQHAGVVQLFSHRRKREKKSLETVLRMESAAVACLSTAVILLLLAVLFMQISGVSLALTWPCRLFVEFSCAQAAATSLPLSKHTGAGDTAPAFSGQHVYLQFTWEVGLPLSPVEFSSHSHFYKLFRSWLLGVCHCSCLLWLDCLFTVP